MVIVKKRIDLKDVLMDSFVIGVKEPYYQIIGENGQNITIVSPGKNGNEFNKTYGQFNISSGPEIYHVLYGQGVMALQRDDEEGEAKEFKIASLRPGVTVEVPSGLGQLMANVGKTYLVVIDNGLKPSGSKNEMIKQRRGLAYYIVDKKGEIGFEFNPNYKMHPEISTFQ